MEVKVKSIESFFKEYQQKMLNEGKWLRQEGSTR